MEGASNVELEQFRLDWLAEVSRRSIPTSSAAAASSGNATQTFIPLSTTFGDERLEESKAPPAHMDSDRHPRTLLTRNNAVEVYRQAVDAETRGSLDEALRLYRRAFRLDPNVDRAFELEKRVDKEQVMSDALAQIPLASTSLPLVSHIPHGDSGRWDAVDTSIASSTSEGIAFAPLEGNSSVPMQSLPTELIISILRFFSWNCDYTTLERFAAVCRKARLITMDNSLWRDIVRMLYRPPQIPENSLITDIVDTMYRNDYRNALILHPRVRFDGVYIAVCHYVRPGLSENAWVNVSHLITYHRYLRFFQDGSVLSLLANDENPSDVVYQLKTSFTRSGLYIGTWRVSGSGVLVRDLVDLSGTVTKYAFEMSLVLRSKPLGRWNKLEMTQYRTKRIDTGDTESLPLKNQRPFWFSKVRSYRPYS